MTEPIPRKEKVPCLVPTVEELLERANEMLGRAVIMVEGWQDAVDWHNDYLRFKEQNGDTLAPTTGYALFSELCETLIEEGENYLAPEIGRTRSTDWMAFIFTHTDETRREMLATGQAGTMDEACAAAVANYHEQKRIEARKAELLLDPNVQEALRLFKKGG